LRRRLGLQMLVLLLNKVLVEHLRKVLGLILRRAREVWGVLVAAVEVDGGLLARSLLEVYEALLQLEHSLLMDLA
jgi:hypothetical protein